MMKKGYIQACLSLFLVFLSHVVASSIKQQILQHHRAIVRQEESSGIGGDIILSDKEQQVNSILLDIKRNEHNASLQNNEFPPAIYFFTAKPLYEKSQVFDIIRRMPKGADLHLHGIAMVKPEWILKHLTYLPQLYFCIEDNPFHSTRFKFADKPPKKLEFCKTEYELVSEARKKAESVEDFDFRLLTNLSMVDPSVSQSYPNYNIIWNRFISTLNPVADLAHTGPGFKLYFTQALQQLYDDNILYAEIRSLLLPILEVNGTSHDQEYTLTQFKEVIDEFKAGHPDFYGAKIIFISVRQMTHTRLQDDIELAIYLHQKYPDFQLGFDLVGNENLGPPLIDLLDILITPARQKVNLPFFFHAGETDWFGTSTDDNLIDAILLNTTRIGHGFALPKHPVAMEMVKQRRIPIELNPLSNQVLGLTKDLRDHPGAIFFAKNFPVVICSDDPATWGASGLSYDFYAAYMAFADQDAGLGTLKQLSQNGIIYSTLKGDEIEDALSLWQSKWDAFLEEILKEYGHSQQKKFGQKKNEL